MLYIDTSKPPYDYDFEASLATVWSKRRLMAPKLYNADGELAFCDVEVEVTGTAHDAEGRIVYVTALGPITVI